MGWIYIYIYILFFSCDDATCHVLVNQNRPGQKLWLQILGKQVDDHYHCHSARLSDTASTARSCVQKETPRIRIGNQSNLGFSDRSGSTDNFASLQDKRFGLIAACQYLNLDIIGLPGARMSKTVPLPKGFSMASKGGSLRTQVRRPYGTKVPASKCAREMTVAVGGSNG